MFRSIQKKLVILGAGISTLLVVAAFLTTFFIYKSNTTATFVKSIDNSIEELKHTIGNDASIADMAEFTNIVIKTYEEHKDDVVPEFKTAQEKYDYYANIYNLIYPASGGMIGLSYQKLKFQSTFNNVSSNLKNATISSGGNEAYVGLFIKRPTDTYGRLIYLFDSTFRFDTYDGSGHLIGEEYILTEHDFDEDPNQAYGGMVINGTNSRVVDFELGFDYDYDDDTETEVVVTAFIEYDDTALKNNIRMFAIIEGVSLIVALIILLVTYILMAHYLFVKNIVKLTDSTNKFTEQIRNEGVLELIDPEIKSKDEIGKLSKAYLTMEEEIIEYTAKLEESTKEREKINAELEVGKKIQLEALPSLNINDENFIITASITSAKEVGGDFYDYFYIDKNHLAFTISDVSGKGIPAALFMMKAKELIKSKLISNLGLDDVAKEVNNELLLNNDAGLFITSFIGIIDTETKKLTYVNAGHEKPYLIRDGKAIRIDAKANFILAGIEDFEYEVQELELKENDRFFLFTDGLNEAINGQREEFGYGRIVSTIEDAIKTNGNILDEVSCSLDEFTQDMEPFDDVTMLLIEIKDKDLEFYFEKPKFEIIDEVNAKFNAYYSYLNKKLLSEVNIIMDETLNNYISYEKNDDLFIKIKIENKTDKLIITFINNGAYFNPLERKDKYIEEFDEDMPIGGLGISIVKKLSDEIKYERKNDLNHLIICKNII